MDTGSLERALGYRFANPQLLVQALTHRSFGSPHNERLEFLGDSVLNFVVAWELFREFERSREGDLSRLRASLVRQETLHRLADALQLGNFLALGEGELKSGGFRRPSILADALEAIFGAVLLDGGFEAARSAVLRLYQPLLEGIDPRQSLKDPKTALQEWLQGRRLPLPNYVLVATRGEPHSQEFDVECRIEELGLATAGSGASRRGAEQQAAQRALERISEK